MLFYPGQTTEIRGYQWCMTNWIEDVYAPTPRHFRMNQVEQRAIGV